MKDEESPAARADTPADQGGEPACWLHRLCPQCDAVQDAAHDAAHGTAHPRHCWRCGAELTGTVEGLDLR